MFPLPFYFLDFDFDCIDSLYGGGLMFAVGVLYLLFEKSIIIDSKAPRGGLASSTLDNTSRIILGVQCGLVALAMIVTRSSIITLQAGQGSGKGNIYVGWFTLGMNTTTLITFYMANNCSGFIDPSFSLRSSAGTSLHSPPCGDVPTVLADLHHPHHLL